jgi:hypothetical protein
MKVTGVMHFANRPHLIYTLIDTDYVSLRPLVDQIGLDWRTQKKGLLDDDAVLFYGTLLLDDGKIVQPPCKYNLKNGLLPSHDSEEGQKIGIFCTEDAQKDTVFIRLRRVQIYLARISIGHIKAKGNQSSAEYLLSLHEEWADALHEYETQGVAIKRNHTLRLETKEKGYMRMAAVLREKNKTDAAADRKLLTGMLRDMAQTHGLNYQTDLLDDDQ